MTLPVQIAFQGGGARLALFYGAIKALQNLEKRELIRVTRVSGASAGAIAAALFAGRANIDALLMYHKSLDRNLVNEAFPDLTQTGKLANYFNAAKTAFLNTKIGDEKAFAKILSGAFQAANVTASTVDGLSIPCFINTTDIIRHKSHYAEGGDPLIQALVDSAALPFLFRNGGEKIDGGILDNLPIDVLRSNQELIPELGDILAISFPPDNYSPQVEGAVDLGKRLLATVINNKVAVTKHVLGAENVLELPIEFDDQSFSTFSLQSYMSAATSTTIIDNVRLRTEEWYSQWAKRKSSPQPIVVNSREDANRLNLSQLRSLAGSLHKSSNLVLKETIIEVTASCLQSPDVDDRLEFIDTFEVGSSPVFSYVTRMSVSAEMPPGATSVRIHNSSGDFLPAREFVIPDETGDAFWTMVILEEALHVGTSGTFSVHSKQSGKGIMGPLAKNGCDYLSIQLKQSDSVDAAEIRIFVPTDVKLKLTNGTNDLLGALDMVSYDEIDDHAILEGRAVFSNAINSKSCPPGYHTYVWRAENLKCGDALRVVYTIVKQ
ncbi:patatin-like phospholipase family protein [Rhizobium sp. 22-785-1]